MYNEIEELEKSLTRKPAAVEPAAIDVTGYAKSDMLNNNDAKRVFNLPDLPPQSSDTIYPSQQVNGGEKIVGGRGPDFSGYDDLLGRINKLKPRDTSTADLISMGISTGIGALAGRVGTSAKIAGQYGLDKSAYANKRADDIQNLIAQIEAQKAARMATASKGQKVKSGSGADIGKPYLNRYTDPRTGIVYTPTTIDPKTGNYALRPDIDTPYKLPDIGFKDQKNPDGSIIQVAQMANNVRQVGSQLPQLKTQKNAKGETVAINDRTLQQQGLGDYFNRTSAGLSPHSDQAYKSITDKKNTDPLLRGLEGSYNDMSLGITALNKGDVGGALAAVKMAASALEKGRMTSDKDLAQVSSLNLGFAQKMDQILTSALEGGKLTEANRAELESLFGLIESNTNNAYSRRLGMFNKQAQTMLGKEFRPELAFPDLPRFGREDQTKMLDRAIDNTRKWNSTGEWTQDLIVDGKPIMREGKPVRAVYIMRNGKPFAVREAR